MLNTQIKERVEAFRVLLLWLTEGAFIKESGLSPFAMEVALGVCRRHLFLEYFVRNLVKKMPSLELRVVLEMGLYQMFFMSVPDHAAISTSVELSRSANLGEGAQRLVNGVLRSARRSGLPQMPPQRMRRISIENSVPECIVRRWFDGYAGDGAEMLAKRTLERPAEWLRVNLQKTTAKELVQKLGWVETDVLFGRYIQVPAEVKLKSLLESDDFLRGEFSLQNPAAYQVVELLDVKPSLRIWDACAAPGGKSALLAEMDASLDILASDVSATRVAKMQDLKERLGLKNIQLAEIDVLDSGKALERFLPNGAKFDRILLDVPCSNMGVVSRRPEVLYRLSLQSMKELAELQYKILESAAKNLASNGVLVYATCSPDPMETTQVVARFVKAHPEFVKLGGAILSGNGDSRIDRFFAQALALKK